MSAFKCRADAAWGLLEIRRAARRANDLEKGGDRSGAGIWRQIMTAIEELQRGRRRGISF